MLKYFLLICLLCIPAAFWVFYKPIWFKEGMTYSFSQDTRSVLPEVFKEYRLEFEKWYRSVGKENLWQEARKL